MPLISNVGDDAHIVPYPARNTSTPGQMEKCYIIFIIVSSHSPHQGNPVGPRDDVGIVPYKRDEPWAASWLPGGGAVEQSETEGVWFDERQQLKVTNDTPFAAVAALPPKGAARAWRTTSSGGSKGAAINRGNHA